MGASNPRRTARLTPDDRIAEIMAHARRELADKGHESFLTSGVADRCGVSEATIYRYFPTKRDLLLRVAEEWFEEILSVEPQLANVRGVFEQLKLVIRHSFEVLRREPSLSRYVLLEMRTNPAYRSTKLFLLNRRFTSTVTHVIQRGILDGILRGDISADLVRDMVFGCIENRAWSYLREQRELAVEATAESIASIVFEGLSAPPLRDRDAIAAVLERMAAGAENVKNEIKTLEVTLGHESDRVKEARPRGSPSTS